jgi:hypothetical protein
MVGNVVGSNVESGSQVGCGSRNGGIVETVGATEGTSDCIREGLETGVAIVGVGVGVPTGEAREHSVSKFPLQKQATA